jgi:hypothetical protein
MRCCSWTHALKVAMRVNCVFMLSLCCNAQHPPRHVEVSTVAARPEDVRTIDALIRAFYEVVSGPKGQPRQWARDRTLYLPGTRFVAITQPGKSEPNAKVMTHQEFVDAYDQLLVSTGFCEKEIHRVALQFGRVAHVWSTYEIRRETPDGPLLGRGINSIELLYDGGRWWVAFASWQDEDSHNPIAREFLPSPQTPH